MEEQASLRQVWTRYGRLALLGAVLWVVILVAAYIYAGQTGEPLWPTVVTWQEWVVAVGLIPLVFQVLMGILGRGDVSHRVGRRFVGILTDLGFALLVTFLFDVLTRAVLGLGFKPF